MEGWQRSPRCVDDRDGVCRCRKQGLRLKDALHVSSLEKDPEEKYRYGYRSVTVDFDKILDKFLEICILMLQRVFSASK